MSKVIFFGTPAYGHFNPTIAVVKELIARGEEVIYYSTPEFRHIIASMGAEFRDYLLPPPPESKNNYDSPADQNRKENLFDINKLIERYSIKINSYFEFLIDNPKLNLRKTIAALSPDYIIHDSLAYWGKILAGQLGIPAISSITLFAYCDQVFDTYAGLVIQDLLWMSDSYLVNPPETRRILKSAAQKIGDLYHIDDFDFIDVNFSLEALNIVYTSKEFQWFGELFDSSFKFVGPSLCPRDDPGKFPLDQLKCNNLIFISLGSFYTDLSFYQKCFAAFAATDRQVVLNIGNTNIEHLGKIPNNFIVKNFVPQLEILRHAALFITPGGMNSVNESLYFNVPLIVIPQVHDQYLVAKRVAELGVGINIENVKFQARDLAEAVETIFSNESYRVRCTIIGESLRTAGGYQRAADEIFQFKYEKGIK